MHFAFGQPARFAVVTTRDGSASRSSGSPGRSTYGGSSSSHRRRRRGLGRGVERTAAQRVADEGRVEWGGELIWAIGFPGHRRRARPRSRFAGRRRAGRRRRAGAPSRGPGQRRPACRTAGGVGGPRARTRRVRPLGREWLPTTRCPGWHRRNGRRRADRADHGPPRWEAPTCHATPALTLAGSPISFTLEQAQPALPARKPRAARSTAKPAARAACQPPTRSGA
jgi:hypothetical protein